MNFPLITNESSNLAKARRRQEQVQRELDAALAQLPGACGFGSAEEFAAAVLAAAGRSLTARPVRRKRKSKSPAPVADLPDNPPVQSEALCQPAEPAVAPHEALGVEVLEAGDVPQER